MKKESALYIEADTHLHYGVVVTAMAVAKNAGVAKVMMLTESDRQPDQARASSIRTNRR